MQPILIIQNDAKEGAGQLNTLLAKNGIKQETVFGYSTDYSRLRPAGYSGLVMLGGAQSAYETDKHPFLQNEIDLCQSFMEAGKPIAGFCLGAQILACALGGEVLSGDRKEIGWYDLILNEPAANDPLIHDHPKTLLSYHFHGDFIKDVPGAIRLAHSAITEWQLFRYGSNVYGFQYHAEVDQQLIEIMCRNNSAYMATSGVDAETVIDESRTNLPEFEARCGQVLNRWVDLCRPEHKRDGAELI